MQANITVKIQPKSSGPIFHHSLFKKAEFLTGSELLCHSQTSNFWDATMPDVDNFSKASNRVRHAPHLSQYQRQWASFKYWNLFSTHLLFLLGNSGELGLDDPSDFRSKKVPGLSNTLCILSAASLLGEKRNQLYSRARVNYYLF